jgi:hypothetical protein
MSLFISNPGGGKTAKQRESRHILPEMKRKSRVRKRRFEKKPIPICMD